MLFVPDHDPNYRIISIDPGTNTLGVALLEVNLVDMSVAVSEADTFSGDRLSLSFPEIIEVHGDRVAKLIAHEENLKRILFDTCPHCVICESPYMGRFPQAYAALVECMSAIRRAVMIYDRTMSLETVDPPTVKKAVGASGRGSNKEEVSQAIQALPNLQVSQRVNLSMLDEHSVDAVAVGYFKYKQLLGEI